MILRGIYDLVKKYKVLVIVNVFLVYMSIIGWNYYDVSYFIGWYEYFLMGRILEVYNSSIKVAYPPLAILLFVTTHALASIVSYGNIFIIRLIDKIPLLIAFNAVYYLLSKRYGERAGYLWLLTFVAYTVILGYQFDLISALFVLLAALSFEREEYWKTGLYIAIASLFKQSLTILFFIPLIYLYKNRKRPQLIRYVLATVIPAIIIIIPFFAVAPCEFLDKVLFFHARRPPQYLSIWAIPIYLSGYTLIEFAQTLSSLWLPLFLVYLGWVFYRALREYTCSTSLYFIKYSTLVTAGMILLNKIGNINYFLWLAPTLIPLITSTNVRSSKVQKRLIELYVFTNAVIAFIFGFIIGFAQLVAGVDMVFVFEDMKWMPADKFLYESYGKDPFNIYYTLILQLRLIPAIREAAYSIAIVHHYLAVVTIMIYVYALVYFIYVTYKTKCV